MRPLISREGSCAAGPPAGASGIVYPPGSFCRDNAPLKQQWKRQRLEPSPDHHVGGLVVFVLSAVRIVPQARRYNDERTTLQRGSELHLGQRADVLIRRPILRHPPAASL